MFEFKSDQVSVNETELDFEKLGLVSINDMGRNIPYYGFDLPHYSEEKCKGDCSKFIDEHYELLWEQTNFTTQFTDSVTKHKGRICTIDDVGHKVWNKNQTFHCPPKSGLFM